MGERATGGLHGEGDVPVDVDVDVEACVGLGGGSNNPAKEISGQLRTKW